MTFHDFQLKNADADEVLDILKHVATTPGTMPSSQLSALIRRLQSYVDKCDADTLAEADLVAAQEVAGGMPV